MLNQSQTYLLLALGIAMGFVVWTDPVLFEYHSLQNPLIVMVTNSWTYEIFSESQSLSPFPNYWMIGGFYGVIMVWVISILTYNRPKAQFYWIITLSAILIAYGIETLVTFWVYRSEYYQPDDFKAVVNGGTAIPFVMAGLAILIALYTHKRSRIAL
jgi:hypothetical protein